MAKTIYTQLQTLVSQQLSGEPVGGQITAVLKAVPTVQHCETYTLDLSQSTKKVVALESKRKNETLTVYLKKGYGGVDVAFKGTAASDTVIDSILSSLLGEFNRRPVAV